jgi:tetratricopeptide (TPR) repeat protein
VVVPRRIEYPLGMRFLAAALVFSAVPLRAASAREELKAVVAQVAAAPGDRALREKAIALARKVKPAPVVPPEAKRPFVMAATFQNEAKTPSDFGLAVDAYQEALKAAPWWGDAYFNLSVSLESAGRFDEAREALSLYLLTKPADEAAQNRLYALEAKKKLAAKQLADAVRSWFCPWLLVGGDTGTFLTLDSAARTITYEDRNQAGMKPPVVTSLGSVDGDVHWAQNETFSNGNQALVRYTFSPSSGGLDYTYEFKGKDFPTHHDCHSIAARR